MSTDVTGWSALERLPFGTVGGEEISLRRALRLTKLDFSDQSVRRCDWAYHIVERIVLQQAAGEAGLTPESDDIQALMTEFRKARGLYSAKHTEQFLAQSGCTVEDFAEAMELQWAERALRRKHAEQPAEMHFRQNMAQYDSAVLSELMVAEEGLASELALQIREEEADFASLARRYSVAASRGDAGFLGEVRRGKLGGAESAAVFGAAADEVVGPFAQGRQFRLLRVHEVRRAEYTETVRQEIEDALWSEWLQRRIQDAKPEITLLRHL